jgi:hypothetical protein
VCVCVCGRRGGAGVGTWQQGGGMRVGQAGAKSVESIVWQEQSIWHRMEAALCPMPYVPTCDGYDSTCKVCVYMYVCIYMRINVCVYVCMCVYVRIYTYLRWWG